MTQSDQCGRLLVGQGTDTWDPTCLRPARHTGPCSAAPLPDLKLDDYGVSRCDCSYLHGRYVPEKHDCPVHGRVGEKRVP